MTMTKDLSEVPKERLGQALQAARTMLGLEPQEAADAIGVSVRRLRSWEAGKRAPHGDEVSSLASVYGLDIGGNLPARTPIIYDEAARRHRHWRRSCLLHSGTHR